MFRYATMAVDGHGDHHLVGAFLVQNEDHVLAQVEDLLRVQGEAPLLAQQEIPFCA